MIDQFIVRVQIYNYYSSYARETVDLKRESITETLDLRKNILDAMAKGSEVTGRILHEEVGIDGFIQSVVGVFKTVEVKEDAWSQT